MLFLLTFNKNSSYFTLSVIYTMLYTMFTHFYIKNILSSAFFLFWRKKTSKIVTTGWYLRRLFQGLVPAEKFAFLISLGSPHQAPVIPERSLVNFTKVTRKNRIFRPEELNCVSVSGGLRDIQVRPALSLSDPCINVRGESVPLTWTSQVKSLTVSFSHCTK